MNTFTEWFDSLYHQAGTNAAIIELLQLYDNLTEQEKSGDVLMALQNVYDTTGTLSLPQVLVRERLNIFNEIRQELQQRFDTFYTPMVLSEVSSRTFIYDYVIERLDIYAGDKPNKQLLHKYYFDKALSDEDGIYVLTGAVLASHMPSSEMAVTLVNLAGTLCMKIDKRFKLNMRTPTPCNCTYTELWETGKLLFNGLTKSEVIQSLDKMLMHLEAITTNQYIDFFSGIAHTVSECVDLAKQYAEGAGIKDVSDFDAVGLISGGSSKLLYLIGMYAYFASADNKLAFDIILTLAKQLTLLYGKRLEVNTNFFNEDKEGMSYTDIARLLFTEK